MSGGVRIDVERLRSLREARVMGRRELAEKARVGFSTYADLESGYQDRARPATIKQIARALGSSLKSFSRPGDLAPLELISRSPSTCWPGSYD